MMQKIVRSLLVVATVSLAAVHPASATGGFSNSDLRGPYAAAFDGFVISPAGAAPVAAVGRFVADGEGNLRNGVRTLSLNGQVLHQTLRCTYSVAPQGTGSVTCHIRTDGVPSGTEHYDFVLVGSGEEAFFTSTDPGVTIRGEAKRQQPGR
jgi:hypothetical protein